MRSTCPGGGSSQGNILDASVLISADSAVRIAFNGTVNVADLYCAVGDQIKCHGICPNADVTGVGVRAAFYLNAVLTALLVGLSPEDSPSAAWSSAILTISLVIPAIIQKKQEALTLYHATQVLNFVTFSSVASLAVAPLCKVWRVIDNKDHPQHITRLESPIPLPNLSPRNRNHFFTPPSPTETTHTTGKERHRSRVILSLALIAQVSLQWTWATYLFTSPDYSQQICNQETNIVLFGRLMTAETINDHHFWLWAGWLLFSILVTLLFSILLVISSTSGANAHKRPRNQLRPPKVSWIVAKIKRWDPKGNKRRVVIFAIAFMVCTALVVFSELQAKANCVSGENTQWGFGQIAALLFALSPLWGIVQALDQKAFVMFQKKENGSQPQDPASNAYQGHSRNPSTEPLLLGGERSPMSLRSHSPLPSELGELPVISSDGVGLRTFLPNSPSPTDSMNSSLVHTPSRRRGFQSRSSDFRVRDEGITIELTPPTRPQSREELNGNGYL